MALADDVVAGSVVACFNCVLRARSLDEVCEDQYTGAALALSAACWPSALVNSTFTAGRVFCVPLIPGLSVDDRNSSVLVIPVLHVRHLQPGFPSAAHASSPLEWQ